MLSLALETEENVGTILIVDDDPTVQTLITELIRYSFQELKIESPAILVASSAEEGVLLVAANRIDLMFVDYHLPGISGLELIRTVRLGSDIATGTVLMSSDYENLNRVSKRKEIDAILKKPVNRNTLKKILETFFLSTLGPPSG